MCLGLWLARLAMRAVCYTYDGTRWIRLLRAASCQSVLQTGSQGGLQQRCLQQC